MAKKVVEERIAKKKPHLYDRPMQEMSQWIGHFLGVMRNNFPETHLQTERGEAMAIRQGGSRDMRSFNPKDCGWMLVNKTIINNMILCRQRSDSGTNFDLFKYQMGISIAHEIVHFLVGFLIGERSGQQGQQTPPKVVLQPYGTTRRGESGRYWEKLLLGGVSEFYYDDTDSMDKAQAGLPFLFEDGRPTTLGKPIDLNYIQAFINGRE